MPIYNPTGFKLPSLVFDPKTRVGGEFFLYYNLGVANVIGSVGLDGASVAQYQAQSPCGVLGTNPSGGFAVARIKRSLITPSDTIWVVNALSGAIPASSPVGQSVELGAALTTVTTFAVSGAQPGDSIDIVVLPDPANDVLICFDQGLNAQVGVENKPIPRKFDPVTHYVRQRPDNSISLQEMYCCNLKGLSKIRQRDVTLIGKFYADGGSIPSEIIYFTGARLNVPKEIPQEANDSVMISAEGKFSKDFCFTALPTNGG